MNKNQRFAIAEKRQSERKIGGEVKNKVETDLY